MKKTILTMVVTASLAAGSQASAMDVNAQNIAPDVSASNYFSENSFEQYGNPQSGAYVGVHAINGKFTQTTIDYTNIRAGDDTVLNPTTRSVKGFGVSIGHQDSQITDSLAHLLQIKRVSYGLEIDSTSGQINGPGMTIGNPDTFSAQYRSIALMAMSKINILQVWRFSPYFEFGGGVMHQTLYNYTIVADSNQAGSVSYPAAKNTGLAYQFGAGVDLFVTGHFDASVGYRYVSTNQIQLSNQAENSTSTVAESPTFKTNQGQWMLNMAYDF